MTRSALAVALGPLGVGFTPGGVLRLLRCSRSHLTLYAFLEPGRARDVCVVPDTLVIFARGLRVERLASFDAPDAHTEIAERFEATYVLANLSGGGVFSDLAASGTRSYATIQSDRAVFR